MEKNSISSSSDFLSTLQQAADRGEIPEKYTAILSLFYKSYKDALESHKIPIDRYIPLFHTFLNLVQEQMQSPFSFSPYHQQIREPFDYYAFGLEFVRPLVDMHLSSVSGLSYADEIAGHLQRGHNVILLSNHQTEADPIAINLLLEKTHPDLAANMIFVAGDRVVTDLLAIPFSMGLNLLCIYSKRYIEHPPEQKLKKQLHNKRTMELMSELLSEGGKCIYVAPSGGRDRLTSEGVVEVAPFDPQSVQMFYLMAQKSSHPTFFYTLALGTYDLLPPPETIQIELGEYRQAKRGDIHLAFGPKVDMEHFPGSDKKDKHAQRKSRADYIWNLVKLDYSRFAL